MDTINYKANKMFKVGSKIKPINKSIGDVKYEDILKIMKNSNKKYLEITRISQYSKNGKLIIWADTYDSGLGFTFYENDVVIINNK